MGVYNETTEIKNSFIFQCLTENKAYVVFYTTIYTIAPISYKRLCRGKHLRILVITGYKKI